MSRHHTLTALTVGVLILVTALFGLASWISVSPASAVEVVTVTALGQQVGTLSIPSTAQHVGGGFSLTAGSDTTVTKMVARKLGTVSDSDVTAVKLFYDIDSSSPYDCASETYSSLDATYGFATSFSAGKATYTGSLAIGSMQTVCFYVVLDIKNSATNGETLEIEARPADIIVSGDFTVESSDPSSPTADEEITGTTVLVLPPPSVVSVTAVGTQVSTISAPSEDRYIGGTFQMSPDTGSATVKQVIIKEAGTVDADADLAKIRFFYDLDASAPYDCISETYAGDEPQYGVSTSFDGSSQATFSGSVTITTTQVVCFYTVLDVQTGATDGQTIEIEITAPSSDVVVEVGGSVLTTSKVAISGTTLIELPPEFNVTVSATGTQVPLLQIPSIHQYIGGAFRMTAQTGAPIITKLTFYVGGSVGVSDTAGVHLHYDLDISAPYDCASESHDESDLTYGDTVEPTFSRSLVYTGNLELDPTKAACFYAVLDITDGTDGESLEIEFTKPSTFVTASGGATVTPSTDVEIIGTTTLTKPPPVVLIVSAIGTQASLFFIPSTSEYVGGAFRMVSDNGSVTITKVSIREGGSVSENNNLANVKLYYDFDTTDPYDCASESFSVNDPTYGLTTSFVSGKAAFTDTATAAPAQTACFYVVLDVESGASDGQTLEIEISNPTSDVLVGEGAEVSPSTKVALAAATTLKKPLDFGVTVSAIGTQTPLMEIPSKDQYVGGAFRMLSQSETTLITKVTITTAGTVSRSDLVQMRLHYDFDIADPYNCVSESYDPGDPMYGVPVDLKSVSKAVYTGDVEVSPTKAACFYVVLDVESGASDGETLEVKIARPSTDIIASEGVTVSPSSAVEIIGTTTLTINPIVPVEVFDGDLVRATGDYRVHIVKIVETKKFIRHIIDSEVFNHYGHFSFSAVKEVPNLEGYTLSAWVRLPLVAGDTESEKVFEINDDPGAGGSKHWITCVTPTTCETTWRAHGGDPDGVYTINKAEMDYYVLGPNVFLQ